MFNRMGGIIGGADPNLVFGGSRVDSVNHSYSFSNVPVGDPHPDRMVVVLVTGSSGLQYCRINGVDADPVGTYEILSQTYPIPLFYRKISSGTTVNVAVNFDVNYQCGIAVYSFNTTSTGPLDYGRSSSPVSNIECAANGVVIAGAHETTGSPPAGGVSWNGVDSISLDVGRTVEGSVWMWSGHVLTTENSTVRDLSSGESGTVNVASFLPP